MTKDHWACKTLNCSKDLSYDWLVDGSLPFEYVNTRRGVVNILYIFTKFELLFKNVVNCFYLCELTLLLEINLKLGKR